jgi:hypothetical protein
LKIGHFKQGFELYRNLYRELVESTPGGFQTKLAPFTAEPSALSSPLPWTLSFW